MTHIPRDMSLFARKLRDWRALNGTHGRMTQEELAERLGISVDAVGKYERSVSFIRGDLEHRLADRLGWERDDILACRADWDARQRLPRRTGYQLLDKAALDSVFGGSWSAVVSAIIDFSDHEFGPLPSDLAVVSNIYQPVYEAMPDQVGVVILDGRIVAKWALPLLTPEDEMLFRDCRYLESTLSPDRIRRPLLPGSYFGYCPGLIIAPGHEAAAPLLLSSFVRMLEALAERGILLHGIGSISVSASGAQISRDLGMERLGDHRVYSDYGVWELPGKAVAGSILARRSPILRRRYAEMFGD